MSTRYVWSKNNVEYLPQVVDSSGPSVRTGKQPMYIFTAASNDGLYTNWYDGVADDLSYRERCEWTRYDEQQTLNAYSSVDPAIATISAGDYFCYTQSLSDGLPFGATNYRAVTAVGLQFRKLSSNDYQLYVNYGTCQHIQGVQSKGTANGTVSNASSGAYQLDTSA